MADVSKLLTAVAPGIKQHLRRYIETDGADGYYRDMSEGGGSPRSTTLVLKTVGRKSGRSLLAPLLFSTWKGEWVIVASKAGADTHPGWFYNLTAADEVAVQVKDKRYRCKWRIAEGAERQEIWPFMVEFYPPYHAYQSSTTREIPVVVLTPVAEIPERFAIEGATGVDVRTDHEET
jgi:deazaflavin-dependent oxidoreductase (nitroreductase family)